MKLLTKIVSLMLSILLLCTVIVPITASAVTVGDEILVYWESDSQPANLNTDKISGFEEIGTYTGSTDPLYTYNVADRNWGTDAEGAVIQGYTRVGNSEDASGIIQKELPVAGQYELQYFFCNTAEEDSSFDLGIAAVDGAYAGTVTRPVDNKSGWVVVGTYNFAQGMTNISVPNQRFSAAKFVYVGENAGNVSAIETQNVQVQNAQFDLMADRQGHPLGNLGTVYYEDFSGYTDYADFVAKSALGALPGKTNVYSDPTKTYFNYSLAQDGNNPFLKFDTFGQSVTLPQGQTNLQLPTVLYNFQATGKVVINFKINLKDGVLSWYKFYVKSDAGVGVQAGGMGKELFSVSGNAPADQANYISRDSSQTAYWFKNAVGSSTNAKLPRDQWVDVKLIVDLKDGNDTLRTLINDQVVYGATGSNAAVEQDLNIGDIGTTINGFSFLRSLSAGVNVGYDSLDDIRIFTIDGPLKAAYAALPTTQQALSTPEGMAALEKARFATTEASTVYGITPSTVEGYQKLVDCENFLINANNPINLVSDIYNVNGSNISGVLYGSTVNDLVAALSNHEYYVEVVGKQSSDIVETGDVVRAIKYLNTSNTSDFTITIDRFFTVVSPLEINYSTNTISQIPYGMAMSDFLNKVVHSDMVDANVYTGALLNVSGKVLDNDILKVSIDGNVVGTYSLDVIPPSPINTLVSAGAYTLTDTEISNIPYGTTYPVFVSNLVLPFGATLVTDSYYSDYTGSIDSCIIKVVAQTGDIKEYTVTVNPGRSISALSATTPYIVDNDKKTISGVDRGASVQTVISKLAASDNGSIKLLNNNLKQITTGTISGNEIVRVYSEAGNYVDYGIICNLVPIITVDGIITINDPECVKTGSWAVSGAVVDPGYNKITTINSFNGAITFKDKIKVADTYDVYIYSTYFANNALTPVEVYNGTTKLDTVNVDMKLPTGWLKIGTYTFDNLTDAETGAPIPPQAYIKLSGTGGQRLSAARFCKTGNFLVDNAGLKLGSNDTITLDNGTTVENAASDVATFTLTFSHDVLESTLNSDNIRLVTENGYQIPCNREYNRETKTYTMSTNYDLVPGIKYYLQVTDGVKVSSGGAISTNYSYLIDIQKNEVDAGVRIKYKDTLGKFISSINGAKSADVTYELTNNTTTDKTVKVVTAYYKGVNVGEISVKTITIPASSNLTDSAAITMAEPATDGSKIKVFVWDSNNNPLTWVEYK